MDTALITGMAAVLGSLAGGSASIVTAWMTQHSQKIREHAQAELHRRETLYGEFITETARLTADAIDHSLEHPETLTKVYAILGRIRLVASPNVFERAEECCRFIVDLYAKPNLTTEQTYDWFRTAKHPLRDFAASCRAELDQYIDS
jgi:hypothetical protein